MTFVKNIAGLLVVFSAFALTFIISGAMIFFSSKTIDRGPVFMLIGAFGMVGLVMSGWVLFLFFKNFRFSQLNVEDAKIDRSDAPVVIQINYDDKKEKYFIIDSRLSPRQANPSKLGRGVFITTKKVGRFNQEAGVVELFKADKSNIKEVRTLGRKVYFRFIDNDSVEHHFEIVGQRDMSVNFGTNRPGKPLTNAAVSKQQIAERWAKDLS